APGEFEERQGTLAVAERTAPPVHDRLVEIGDRAQRPGPLLVEDGTGTGEPLARLVVPALERRETRERQPAVDVRVAEVRRDDLVAKGTLDRRDVVGELDEPERVSGGTGDGREVPQDPNYIERGVQC